MNRGLFVAILKSAAYAMKREKVSGDMSFGFVGKDERGLQFNYLHHMTTEQLDALIEELDT